MTNIQKSRQSQAYQNAWLLRGTGATALKGGMAYLEQMSRCSTLSGAWILDVYRSDTLEGYLRCLLVPAAAIQAQVEGERAHPSRNVIGLDTSNLIIHKRTAASNVTEDFEIDEEQVIETNTGAIKRTKASLGEGEQLNGYVLVSQTLSREGPNLVQVEARQLEPGGLVHTQELNVHNLRTGQHCIVNRVWVRVAVTREDVRQLSPPASG